MKMNILKYALLAIGLCLLFFSFTSKMKVKRENGTVGDIKYSILEYNLFVEANGCGWVLLNGKTLPQDSELFTFLESRGSGELIENGKLPNADGMFIRGMDTNPNDSIGDPDAKKRTVGSYQEDALKKHKHPLQRNIHKHGRSFRGADGGDHPLKNKGPQWMTATKSVGDDMESRPKNISLYVYIKINNECD